MAPSDTGAGIPSHLAIPEPAANSRYPTGVRVLLVFLLSLAAALAQTPQERGKRLIDQTLAALGGDRFLAVQDRTESGRAYSFYHEKLSGLGRAAIYTRYVQRPDPPVPGTLWVRERQSFGPNERSGAVLFADGKGYQITFRGARPVPPETLDRYQDSTLHNVFYILRQRLGEPELAFDYQDADRIDNRIVDVVDISDADNRSVRVYLDRLTKLPVRQLYVPAIRKPATASRRSPFSPSTATSAAASNGLSTSSAFATTRKSTRSTRTRSRSTRVSPRACSCCPRSERFPWA